MLIGMLSYEARSRNLSVLTSVYKSGNTPADRNPRRSLAAAADLQIATEARSSSLTFRCDGIESWPANKFDASVYLALNT